MDKVRFQAQERLDLVDTNAIQDLVGQYIGEALGGLMGNSAGALTSIEYTHANVGATYTFSLSAFQYYWAAPENIETVTLPDTTTRQVPKKYKGLVVSYDPSDPGQADTIDWSAVRNVWLNSAVPADNGAAHSDHRRVHGGYYPGNTWLMPILWARPYTLEGDSDARREWNVAAQAEMPITINTRKRTRTEFAYSQDTPVIDAADTNQNAWVPVARTVAWNYDSATPNVNAALVPDVPLLEPIYVWDNHFNISDTPAQAGGVEGSLPNAGEGAVGQGIAGFQSETGGATAWPGTGAKPAPSKRVGADFFENPPFENSGAVTSNLARGNWLPGTAAGTGSPGVHPSQAGGGTAEWPYPGSYYDIWDSSITSGTAVGTEQWVSLKDEGFHVEDFPIWRLGIPQVMSIMRRQLSVIMDSRMNRPWYAMPSDTGGLFQLRADLQGQINAEEVHHRASVTHRDTNPNTSVVIAAAGRAWGNPDPAAQAQDGMKLMGYGLQLGTGGTSANGTYQEFTTAFGGNGSIISVTLGEIPYGCQYDSEVDLTDPSAPFVETGILSPYYNNSGAIDERGILGDYGGGTNVDPVLSKTYVVLGKVDGSNPDTHFTLWTVSQVTKTMLNAGESYTLTNVVDVEFGDQWIGDSGAIPDLGVILDTFITVICATPGGN